jgi:hypothetical protein
MSRLRGHFSLDGASFEAVTSRRGLPKLVIQRKSGVPYVVVYSFFHTDCRKTMILT